MIARLDNPHKQAAVGYAGLGVLVIFITFAADLVPASRSGAVVELTIGATFILIFAALIYYRGLWPLSALLVFSNSWRALTYFNDGRGLHLEIFPPNTSPFEILPPSISPIESQPVAFINSILMVIIVVLLARSALSVLSSWRLQRAT